MPTQTHAVTVSDSMKSLCGCLWRPLFSLGHGAPLSVLYRYLSLFCISEHRDSLALTLSPPFFFAIVPMDECLTISCSGGFETGWTNDLASFVPGLKGTGNGAHWRKEHFVQSAPSSYVQLLFYLYLCWKLSLWSLIRPIKSGQHMHCG